MLPRTVIWLYTAKRILKTTQEEHSDTIYKVIYAFYKNALHYMKNWLSEKKVKWERYYTYDLPLELWNIYNNHKKNYANYRGIINVKPLYSSKPTKQQTLKIGMAIDRLVHFYAYTNTSLYDLSRIAELQRYLPFVTVKNSKLSIDLDRLYSMDTKQLSSALVVPFRIFSLYTYRHYNDKSLIFKDNEILNTKVKQYIEYIQPKLAKATKNKVRYESNKEYTKFANQYRAYFYKYLMAYRLNKTISIIPYGVIYLFKKATTLQPKINKFYRKQNIIKVRKVVLTKNYNEINNFYNVPNLLLSNLYSIDSYLANTLNKIDHSYIENIYNPYSDFVNKTHIKVYHKVDNTPDSLETVSTKLTLQYKRTSKDVYDFYKTFIKSQLVLDRF